MKGYLTINGFSKLCETNTECNWYNIYPTRYIIRRTIDENVNHIVSIQIERTPIPTTPLYLMYLVEIKDGYKRERSRRVLISMRTIKDMIGFRKRLEDEIHQLLGGTIFI